MQDTVVHWAKKVIGNEEITLQQHGATSHTTRMIQDWWKKNFKSFWIKNLWPPSFPDLNPMDFLMWSILKLKACAVFHSSIEVLKTKLTKPWTKTDVETVRTTWTELFLVSTGLLERKEGILNKSIIMFKANKLLFHLVSTALYTAETKF